MLEKKKVDSEDGVWKVKVMLVLSGILAALVAGFLCCNYYRLQTVTLEGLTRYTEQEFKGYLQQGFLYSLTPFFCFQDTIRQKEIPFIEKYEIDYVDRQTAKIRVYEKRVTGCVVVMGRYLYFDKDGIIVETSDTHIETIPVITGLKFDEIVLYQQLNVQKQSLFDTILQLTRLIEENELPVQEIAFDSSYEVTLYLDKVTVLLGKRTSYDEPMNALAEILVVIQGRTGTLDMRSYTGDNGEVILKEP